MVRNANKNIINNIYSNVIKVQSDSKLNIQLLISSLRGWRTYAARLRVCVQPLIFNINFYYLSLQEKTNWIRENF